jgi:hypothetical protein
VSKAQEIANIDKLVAENAKILRQHLLESSDPDSPILAAFRIVPMEQRNARKK